MWPFARKARPSGAASLYYTISYLPEHDLNRLREAAHERDDLAMDCDTLSERVDLLRAALEAVVNTAQCEPQDPSDLYDCVFCGGHNNHAGGCPGRIASDALTFDERVFD